ncbi:MAG: hypothetical protein ACRC2T_12865 [Thermoguttaceae bacterium]
MPKKAAKKVTKSRKNPTGAGRPMGSGKYGCATKPVRIPTHLENDVKAFILKKIKEAKKSAG